MANHNVSLQWTNAGSIVTEATETINNVAAGDTITFTVTASSSVFGRMFAPSAHENNSYWNNTGTFIGAGSGSFDFVYTIPSSLSTSGLYSFYFTFSFNPSLTNRTVQPVQINFASSLTAPDISLATPAASGAVGNTVSLSATNSGGAVDTWTWTENSGAGTLTGNNNTATYVWPDNIGANRTASITVEAENTEGTDSVTITLTQNDIDTVLTGAQTVTFEDTDDTVSFTLGSLEVGTQLRVLRNPASGDSLVGATTITSTSQSFTTKDLQTGNNGGAFDPTEAGNSQVYTPQVRVNSSDSWVSTTGGNITLSKVAGPKVIITIKSTWAQPIPDEPAIQSLTATASPLTFGSGTTSSDPIKLSAGDIVRFVWDTTSTDATNATLASFDSSWTNTDGVTISSSVNQEKTWASGNAGDDTDTVTVNSNGNNTLIDNIFFAQQDVTPDTSVTYPSTVKVDADATQFSLTVTEASPNNNSGVTVYKITSTADGNDISGNTTEGPTTLTVNAGPPSASNTKVKYLGTPYTYYLHAVVETSDGGDGEFRYIGSFTVTWGDAPGSNPPNKDSYGIAIYDDEGTFVTSFTEGYTILRNIFTDNSVTLSTTDSTTVNLGLSNNISDSNCVATIRGNPGSGKASNFSYDFDANGDLVIGRTPSATTASVSVLQYKGDSESSNSSNYGVKIYNGDNDVVIDELTTCYGVREVYNVGATIASQNINANSVNHGNYYLITLTNGVYPFTETAPIPAINSTGAGDVLLPPVLFNNSQSMNGDTFYRSVQVFIPDGADPDDYNLAMLVDSATATPSFYGGSDPGYGFEVQNADGDVVFNSGWRQAIVNNVIDANVFTTGQGVSLGKGSSGDDDYAYNVETGFTGVSPPEATDGEAEIKYALTAGLTEYKVERSGLNPMDPVNTYVLGGNMVSGYVEYYRGDFEELGGGLVEDNASGTGGEFYPSVSINSSTSVVIEMFRVNEGPNADVAGDGDADRCQITDESHHPEGSFVLVRIT